MPGISVISSANRISPEKASKSIAELRHKERIEASYLIQTEKVSIGFSAYAGYPVRTFEDEKMLILLEGLVYGKSDQQVDSSLRNIANEYYNRDHKRCIREFIESSDGDYIVLIFFKSSKITLIFNDRWGRLPAFYISEDKFFAFSREIKFLLHWISNITFDQIALAEHLMYNYTLGEKTIIKGITRLSPASLLEINCSERSQVIKDVLFPINFDTKNTNLTRDEAISRCVSLYQESLLSRVKTLQEKGLHLVVDISGGHDTRAVFGGICQTDALFSACTDGLITGDESDTAQQLADHFGRELHKFSAYHPVDNFAIVRDITYLCDCGNAWNAVSSYYDSLEREKFFQKPTAHLMGFGGEFIRHPYKLKKHYSSFIAMLKDAAYTDWNSGILPDVCLAINRVTEEKFNQNLEYEAAKFPEGNDEDKVKHLYFEYYNKQVNSGEDRHRMFSWTVQPLWGKNLLAFELQFIPRKMISFKFFIDFLRKIDKKLLDVPFNNSKLHLNKKLEAKMYLAKARFIEVMLANYYAPKLYKWIKRKVNNNPKGLSVIDEIRRICKEEFVAKQFDVKAIDNFLEQYPRTLEAYRLLTIVVYVSEVGRRFPEKIK